MTAAERGFALLSCALGDSCAVPLTLRQLRELSKRVSADGAPKRSLFSDLRRNDLERLGYEPEQAERIVRLLEREKTLDDYLRCAERREIRIVTRISPDYPLPLSQKLRMDAPPVLFCRGDLSVLKNRCLSVVGSRQLRQGGVRFAQDAGRLIARGGFTLCSGDAEGADRTAEGAALREGGSVLAFIPGRLTDCICRKNVLYVSENGFELPFSAQRALSRNRLIHAMGEKTLVAQTNLGTGGTWSGTTDNLRHGYSPVFVHDDGSEGANALIARGARPIVHLESLEQLDDGQQTMFE